MKYSFLGSAIAVLFLLSSVNAYTVTGFVKSDEGNAVSGAKALLLNKGKSAITDANGEFTLHEDEVPDAIPSYSASTPGFISIQGSVLSYSQSGNDLVQVRIFDLMGNQLLSRDLSGSGSVNLEGFVNAHGTYFAKVKVGHAYQSVKFSASGKYSGIYSGAQGRAILKKAGETDVLRVTADGYDTLRVTLSNLDTTLNLVLTKTAPEYSFGWGLKNDPVPTRGCGKDLTLQKSGNFDWNWSKGTRNIKINIPDNYDKNKPYRLVFGMHCMGGWAGGVQSEGYYGMKPLDTENSTIFVAPEGNGGYAPWGQDDYTLFDELLSMLEGNLCIDSSRVFSSGFSYGSMFTNGLSRDRQAVLRAVAVYETADQNIWLPEPKDLPIAWMGVQGLNDELCYPYMGRSARDLALKHNSAAGKDATKEQAQEKNETTHICYNYQDVDSRFPVRWCTDNAGHIWDHKDAGQQQSWVPASTWEFFTQF